MIVITFDDRRRSRAKRLLRNLVALVRPGLRRSSKKRPALHGLSDHLRRDIGLSP